MVRQQTDQLERAARTLSPRCCPLSTPSTWRVPISLTVTTSAEGKALLAGVDPARRHVRQEGLERIGNPGEAFDPTTHEAVDHVADDAAAGGPGVAAGGAAGAGDGDVAAAGPVIDEVLRPGYRWKGRVIRPAMVRVRG